MDIRIRQLLYKSLDQRGLLIHLRHIYARLGVNIDMLGVNFLETFTLDSSFNLRQTSKSLSHLARFGVNICVTFSPDLESISVSHLRQTWRQCWYIIRYSASISSFNVRQTLHQNLCHLFARLGFNICITFLPDLESIYVLHLRKTWSLYLCHIYARLGVNIFITSSPDLESISLSHLPQTWSQYLCHIFARLG